MKLIFLGPPGAGKGTQAKAVAERYQIPHISTGDMFRTAIGNGTPTGLKAKAFMDAGQLVPDSVVIDMVRERLAQDDCKNGYLLDGFPRTVEQAEALGTFAAPDCALEIAVADEKLISRLTGRRVCPSCGATYHVSFLKDETHCAVCNSELVQRKDDQEETIRSRLAVYHEQTSPVSDYYKEKGTLRTVDGSQPMETVRDQILEALESSI